MKMISRRLNHCALEGEVFKPGSEYFSYLDIDGNRRDYCPTCWEKMQKPEEGSFWRGKIPPKKEKFLQPDKRALAYFRQLDDLKYRFVLALYLQRKKQLARRTQTVYEIPQTGEVFEVEEISISSEEGARIAEYIHKQIEEYSFN